MLDLYLLLDLVVVFALLLLGIVVIMKNRSLELNRIFLLFVICVSVWIMANYVGNDTDGSIGIVTVANYLVFSFSFGAAICLLHFAIAMADDMGAKAKLRKAYPFLLVLCAAGASPLVVRSVELQDKVYAVKFGLLAPIYFVSLIVILGLTIYVLRKNINRTTDNQQARLRVLSRSVYLAFPALILAQAILPAVTGWFGLTNIGILPMTIVVFGLYYGVVKHRLFELRVVIVRALGYALSLGVVAVSYGLVSHEISVRAKGIATNPFLDNVLNVGLIVVIILTYQPLKRYFDKITNRLFYRDAYDPQEFLIDLNKVVLNNVDVDKLLRQVIDVTRNYLKVDWCAFDVPHTEHSIRRVIGKVDKNYQKSALGSIQTVLDQSGQQILVVDDLTEANAKLYQTLQSQNLGLAVRLKISLNKEKESTGYLLLGPKKSGNPFNAQDIESMHILATELAIAMQNALRFEEIEKFNETLQFKVNSATESLSKSNEDIYKRNFELAQTNKTLSLLRTIDELALESHESVAAFCQQITSALAVSGDYPLVSLLTFDSVRSARLKVHGISTSNVLLKDQERQLLESVRFEKTEWFEDKNGIEIIDLTKDSKTELQEITSLTLPQIDAIVERLFLQTICFVKLMARGKLVGVIVVGYAQAGKDINERERDFFTRMGEAVGIALDSKLLLQENERVVRELQRTNEKLKQMDETKDEFIGMASHQLRTPLTSIKGYLSMVLEGDAGKLTEMQTKFLDQAFISSQRMTYLIADLLNVSRLRTGKFVIEPASTNLADVVSGEIGQLTATAADKKLKLIYKKPAKFTPLMLDETKIRQVIMNFTDNAIYYTPAGGTITVALTETPQSVQFTVTDNGIGVPKDEQHHLFGKFFRAGNARKTRPDGTGLGLFMAQKVVVAQGGALIFKSTEGKGSTFGFTFSKAKLKVPDHLNQDKVVPVPVL